MNRRVACPAVVFGRVAGAGGLPGSYRIVSRILGDPRREQAARVVVEGIAPAFAWRPHRVPRGARARHRPAFCLWAEGAADPSGVLLVARILDAGPDELDRPHQVRIEAVALDWSDADAGLARAAALLDPDAWPPEPLADHAVEVEFTSSPTDERRSSLIAEALGAAPDATHPRLLIAEAGSCDWSAGPFIELPVISAPCATGAERDEPWPARASGAHDPPAGRPREPKPQNPSDHLAGQFAARCPAHPPVRSAHAMTSRFAGWLVAFLLAVALGALTMRHLALRADHQQAVLGHEEASRSLGASLAAQVAAAARLEDQLVAATADRERLASELARARHLAIEAEDALRASDPEGVRRENLLLRQLLRAQVDHLRAFVSEQAKLVDEQLGSAPPSDADALERSPERDERDERDGPDERRAR